MKNSKKESLKNAAIIFGAVVFSLLIGMIIAVPILIRLELSFALINFLNSQ